MPHHEQIKHAGTIGDIFAHRFVLKMPEGNVLADLGPKGADMFQLRQGDHVSITGEKKPSEIKVHTICRDGEKPVTIEHPHPKPHHGHEHAFVDPSVALKAADKAGYEVAGEPHRKPKHFELRARDRNGHMLELHIELDGHIRKEKRIERV
jgi:hypothetical protein